MVWEAVQTGWVSAYRCIFLVLVEVDGNESSNARGATVGATAEIGDTKCLYRINSVMCVVVSWFDLYVAPFTGSHEQPFSIPKRR